MVLYLEDLLRPFEYLDISSAYSRYSQIIDLVIVFVVFLGIAKVTLGKRFTGNGGRGIVIGVACALTIGFVAMERTLGISLRSFGGIGAGIFILIVGMVLYGFLRGIGLHFGNALCLSYAAMYLSMRAVAPSIFDFIAGTAPFINGILGILFLFSLGKIIYSFFVSIKTPKGFSPEAVLRGGTKNEISREMGEEKTEEQLFKGALINITRKDLKESDAIIKHLERIKALIGEYGNTDKGRRAISDELTKLSKDERHYVTDLNRLQALVRKLAGYDERELNNLRERVDKVVDEEKGLIQREIRIAEKKIEAEKQLNDFKREVFVLTERFNSFIRTAVNILRSGSYPHDAIRYLDDCINDDGLVKSWFMPLRGGL